MDTEYILDCAFEYGETTAVENAVLGSPKGAYWAVRAAVDQDLHMPQHFLQNTARTHLHQASLPEQYFFALCGLNGLEFSLKAFAERAEHLVQSKLQEDLGWEQGRIAGLLPERDACTVGQLVHRESDISEGVVRHLLDQMCTPAAQRWSEDLALMAQAAHWYRADAGRTFEQMLLADDFKGLSVESLPALVQQAVAAQRKRMKELQVQEHGLRDKAKAAIKKATRLFQGLGQDDNLKLFVSGSEVCLSHPQSSFKFILKPLQVSGWLLDRTMVGRSHTPYELSLYTKEDVFLAKLCVYFNNTPVLDQLLALTLFVQSGEEVKILEKANWFATEQWSDAKTRVVLEAYPQLQDKLPRPRRDDEPRGALSLVDSAFLRKQAHWEPFKGRVQQWVGTWMEPATLAARQLANTLAPVRQQVQDAQQVQRELTRERLADACREVRSRTQAALPSLPVMLPALVA